MIPAPALSALDQASLPADPALSSMLYPHDKTVYRLHLAESGYTYDLTASTLSPSEEGASAPPESAAE